MWTEALRDARLADESSCHYGTAPTKPIQPTGDDGEQEHCVAVKLSPVLKRCNNGTLFREGGDAEPGLPGKFVVRPDRRAHAGDGLQRTCSLSPLKPIAARNLQTASLTSYDGS